MDRRDELEMIILGTLLRTTENDGMEHYISCKSCLSPDMFRSERNKQVYQLVTENLQNGVKSSPYDIFIAEGHNLSPLIVYMAYLASFWDFETKKMDYNENQWLNSQLVWKEPKYTEVTFDDYITEFIKQVFK